MEQLLWTPEEAAELLGVGRCTIYELMRLRVLPSVKIERSQPVPITARAGIRDPLAKDAGVLPIPACWLGRSVSGLERSGITK